MKRDSMCLIACHFFAEKFNSKLLLGTSNNSENKDKVKKIDYEFEDLFNSIDILVYFRLIIFYFY